MIRARNVATALAAVMVLIHAPTVSARLSLALTPDPARGGGALSPEGCYLEPGPVHGLLTTSSAGSICHSGTFGPGARTGVVAGDVRESAELPASFTTGPLAAPLTIGGRTTLGLYIASDEPSIAAYPLDVLYSIEEVREGGDALTIASGTAMSAMGSYYVRRDGSFEIPVHTLAAGSRLRVTLTVSGPSSARLLFGDTWVAEGSGLPREVEQSYADAGITFEATPAKSAGTFGGSTGAGVLATLLTLALMRLSRAPARTPSCTRRAP